MLRGSKLAIIYYQKKKKKKKKKKYFLNKNPVKFGALFCANRYFGSHFGEKARSNSCEGCFLLPQIRSWVKGILTDLI